jgi:glutamine synthetase
MGITPESSHHEQGPGQMEIDFRYGDPLTAADNTSTFKWAVRSICAADGYAADFSPKPIADKPGSGMHLNISVHRIDGEDRKADLDAFMAGILKHIREITLFLNPSEQSYWRFGRMEAPRYISWSGQNRSQLIRVPADPSGRRRVELRSPDPLANPYLAFALLIYAGLDGMGQNMTPPQSIEANLYKEDPALMRGLEQLPASRQEAVQCAMESELVRRRVPGSCLEAYTYERKK